jgi:hypothetical protein
VLALVVLGLVAAVGTLAFMSPATRTDIDPIIGTRIRDSQIAAFHARYVWHVQVRAQARDPNWAPGAEERLRQRFARVPHVGGPNNLLRVICATSICEVAGLIDLPPDKWQNWDRDMPMGISMRELEGNTLHRDLLKAGLDGKGPAFIATKTGRMAFFVYLMRNGR